MSTLLTTYSITTIILILIIAIPAIIKAVKWIIDIVKKHHQNQQEAFEEGYGAAQEDGELEERFEAGEKLMNELKAREDKLESILLNQQQQIETLAASDNLNIKQEIKHTWERVVKFRKPIDSYDLSLLEDRYKIYESRGGNSWAHDMMKEIRKVATTTSEVNKRDQD